MPLTLVRQPCALVAAAATLLSACADSSRPVQLPPAASAIAWAGDQQHGELGVQLPLPIAVRVTDNGGRPILGLSVVFRGDSGATFDPDSQHTDANGIASSHWILGNAPGSQRAIARVEDANYVLFTAQAEHGAPIVISVEPSSVEFTSISSQMALHLELHDAANRAITDAQVSWVSQNPQIVVVDSQGIARPGTGVGTTTIVVVVPSAVHGIIADTTTVTVRRAAQTLFTTPDSTDVFLGGFNTITATVLAQDGSQISNPDVAWTTLTPDLVTLQPSGRTVRVSGAARGRALVVAKYEGYADTSVVRVR